MFYALLLLQAASSYAQIAVAPGTISTDLPVIPKDFCGFGFDAQDLPDFAVKSNGQPQTYSANLINSVAAITGATPIIRVGGTHADNFVFKPHQTQAIVKKKDIGKKFFKYFDTFSGAKFIFQTPLHTMDIDNATAYAMTGIDHIGIQNIQSIAIGNEPNLYKGSLALTPQMYVQKFLKFQTHILNNVPSVPTDTPIFEVYDVSSGGAGNPGFTAQKVFMNNVINKNGLINNCGTHLHYEPKDSPNSDLQTKMLNHTFMTKKLRSMYAADANYIANHHKNIDFILSEASNSLLAGNSLKLTSVLGSALWQVDAQLFLMTIGVKRVNFQQNQGAPGNLWNPTAVNSKNINIPRGTTAPFYAQPFVATLIGPNGQTRVKEVDLGLSGDNADHFVAYAAFEGTNLARVALLNLVTWDGTGTRPTQDFSIKVPSGAKVTVQRLTSAMGTNASGDNVNFAGVQYTFASNGKPTKDPTSEPVNVDDNNMAHVTTNASEAVLVSVV